MTIKAEKQRNLVAKYARKFNKAGGIESKKAKQQRGRVKNLKRIVDNEIDCYFEGDKNVD